MFKARLSRWLIKVISFESKMLRFLRVTVTRNGKPPLFYFSSQIFPHETSVSIDSRMAVRVFAEVKGHRRPQLWRRKKSCSDFVENHLPFSARRLHTSFVSRVVPNGRFRAWSYWRCSLVCRGAVVCAFGGLVWVVRAGASRMQEEIGDHFVGTHRYTCLSVQEQVNKQIRQWLSPSLFILLVRTHTFSHIYFLRTVLCCHHVHSDTHTHTNHTNKIERERKQFDNVWIAKGWKRQRPFYYPKSRTHVSRQSWRENYRAVTFSNFRFNQHKAK